MSLYCWKPVRWRFVMALLPLWFPFCDMGRAILSSAEEKRRRCGKAAGADLIALAEQATQI